MQGSSVSGLDFMGADPRRGAYKGGKILSMAQWVAIFGVDWSDID